MSDKYNFIGARELAKMLGVSTSTLAWRRHEGRPMPVGFQPPGSRMWRYRYSDVIEWIENGMQDGASEEKKLVVHTKNHLHLSSSPTTTNPPLSRWGMFYLFFFPFFFWS